MGWVLATTLPLMALAVLGFAFYAAGQAEAEGKARLAVEAGEFSQDVSRWDESFEMVLRYVASQPDIVSMDPERQTSALRLLVHSYPWIHYAHTTLPTGSNIARSDNESLKDYRDRTWFQQALGGTVAHQTLTKSRSTGRPALNIAAPIRDTSGRVLGVLALGVNMESLTNKVGASKFGETGYLLLVDEQGRALGRPGLSSASELDDLSAFPPVHRLLAESSAGFLEVTDGYGERWLSYAQPILNGWGTVSLQKRGEVLAPVYQLIRIGLGLVLLVGLSICAAIWFVSDNLVRPIQELIDTARQIAAGDWQQRVPINSSTELAALGQTFNDMIEILKERHEAVEMGRQDAEVANLTKSQFLSAISHELRTPLTAILGYADLLKDEVRDKPACLEKIEIIRRDGRHLLTLINDILDLSKIEAGKMTMERTATSPCAIIAEVMSMMRVRATEKGLSLNVEYLWPMPQTIQTDPVRLRQILVNLIGNAIKFTPTGGVRLIVRPPKLSDAHPLITFEVIDSGIGISHEHLAQLFSPFVQGDASTTRRFGGTGLGLTISRRLARLLGGDITAISTPGNGSTFTLVLATGSLQDVAWIANVQEALTHVPSCETPFQEDGSAQTVLVGMKVLLAEDTSNIRLLVTAVLARAGAKVQGVENGLLACQKFATDKTIGQTFDVIVLDMQMPELDGYGAARRLRAEGFAGPIIALTANAMKEDRQRCLDSGCTAYVSKPLDVQELIRTVAAGRNAPPPPTASAAADSPKNKLKSTATDPIIQSFIGEFLVSLAQQVTQLESLLAADDLDGIKKLLHQIKGTSGTYGFEPLTDSAHRAEDAAREADLDRMRSEVLALIKLIKSVEGYEVHAV